MPKGLGDNPLKREKKLRRSSSRPSTSAPFTASTAQGPVLPAGISAPRDAYASPAASYNDVFFHRRPEEPAPSVTIVPETAHEETHVDAPVVAPVESAPAAIPEVVPTETFDPPAPVPVEIIQPVVAVPIESAPEHSEESSPVAIVQETASPPAPVAAADEKKGFFGRIFGKWKKA